MEDYVERAETVMKSLGKSNSNRPGRLNFDLTTSKIRGILSLVNDIYNSESIRNDDLLTEENIAKTQMIRVRMLYEAGREEATRRFVEKSGLLEEIKKIGNSRKNFIEFARYVEALVAYHRYLGGKD